VLFFKLAWLQSRGGAKRLLNSRVLMGMISQVSTEGCGRAVNKLRGYLSSMFNSKSVFFPCGFRRFVPLFSLGRSPSSLLCLSAQPGTYPASLWTDPGAG